MTIIDIIYPGEYNLKTQGWQYGLLLLHAGIYVCVLAWTKYFDRGGRTRSNIILFFEKTVKNIPCPDWVGKVLANIIIFSSRCGRPRDVRGARIAFSRETPTRKRCSNFQAAPTTFGRRGLRSVRVQHSRDACYL